MGDFRLNLLDQDSASAIDFLLMMLSSGTLPSVCIPAQVTDTHVSLIDNIFSSLDVLDNLVLVSDISDHFPTISQYKKDDQTQRRASPSTLPFFSYGDTELSLLNSRLADLPWEILVSDSDFNNSFDSFYDLVKEGILEICNQDPAPHTPKRIAPLNPRMSSGVHKSWKRRNYLWKLYKASSSVPSFEKGIFPESLKRAKVIVLYKGGSRSDPANYRPISLLSVFSKIFEKAS